MNAEDFDNNNMCVESKRTRDVSMTKIVPIHHLVARKAHPIVPLRVVPQVYS